MSFKQKIRKKINGDQRVTLQAKHNERIDYFNEKKIVYQEKKEELNTLKEQLKEYVGVLNNNLTDNQLEDKLILEDSIRELRKELELEVEEKEDVNYLLDTGSILFSYYNQQIFLCLLSVIYHYLYNHFLMPIFRVVL